MLLDTKRAELVMGTRSFGKHGWLHPGQLYNAITFQESTLITKGRVELGDTTTISFGLQKDATQCLVFV